MENENKNTEQMLDIIYKALDDKLGEDIRILDIRNVTVLADFFVIAHGNNPNHINALIDTTEENLEKEGYFIKHKEGRGNGGWVLLDYGNIVIHIFGKEDRYFYDLERIWADGKEIEVK